MEKKLNVVTGAKGYVGYALVKELAPFKEVYMTRAGCTVSSHCGANTLGVLFIRKSPI